MSSGRRLAAYLSLLFVVLGGLAAVDVLSAPPRTAAHVAHADAGNGAIDAGLRRGRAFILVIDSLRFQTAMSPRLMPHLSELRARGTYAQVTPTRDAVTVPCLRAAFTGRDRTRVFGFVENFFKGNAGIDSLFTDLALRGGSAAVYSDGAFDQFGERGIARLSNGDPVAEAGESDDRRDHVDEQNATVPKALADYRSGKHDLVVMHITYTDHVAHQVGITGPLYAQRYRTADELVARLDRELPAEDTFVVMGDHGHDPQGRHAVGLDVPTYAFYRGPRFVPGLDLGTLAIRDHRYLLGFALGVPLQEDYEGAGHDNALRATASELGSYAPRPHVHATENLGVPTQNRGNYALTALLLAAAFAYWLQLTASSLRREGCHASTASPSRLSHTARWAIAACAALVVCALGIAFPHVRGFVHEPTFLTLSLIWLGVWLSAALVTRRTLRLEPGSAVLIALLFVAVPTVYRYGAPAAMGPAWLGWLGCVALLLWAHRQPRTPLASALLLGALLVPFGFAESSGFRFDEWVLWPPVALPNGFLLLASVAKLVVFVPPRSAVSTRVAGMSAAALLSSVQLGLVPSGAQLVGGLAVFALALWLWRRHPDGAFVQPAAITALLLLHHYAVRVPTSAYYWQDCLLAALVLSARMLRNLPQPSRTSGQALLLLFAFFASGWINFAWTLHRLEWGFLYDFWGAAFIESHVAAFMPLLVGRFALTLIAARILLRRELPATHAAEPNEALGLAWLLSGSKVASLMFWSYGIAFVNVASDVYLEAVQETSLACVLLLGLL